MQTQERKPWNDGDEIYGIVLGCSNGYENRGVRQFRRSEFDVLKVGSAPDCHLRDECLASCHALFELRAKKVLIRVVDNVSGVLKNGQRVYGEGQVMDGDELRLGDFNIKFAMMRPPVIEDRQREMSQAKQAAQGIEASPYHHQRAMLSLVEEFKSYYPQNTEIIKIEKLAHHDTGANRDHRHREMLRQLVQAVRSGREWVSDKSEGGQYMSTDDVDQIEEDAVKNRQRVEAMAKEAMPAFEGLSDDELVAEGLRLVARFATAGNMTEVLADMISFDSGFGGDYAPAVTLLLEKHQENSDRDLASVTAIITLLAARMKKEEG